MLLLVVVLILSKCGKVKVGRVGILMGQAEVEQTCKCQEHMK